MTAFQSLNDDSLAAFDPETRRLIEQQRAQALGDSGAAALPLRPGVQNALVDVQENPGRMGLPESAAPDYALAKKVLEGNAFQGSGVTAEGQQPQDGVAPGFRQLPTEAPKQPSQLSPGQFGGDGVTNPVPLEGGGAGARSGAGGGGGGSYGIGQLEKEGAAAAGRNKEAMGKAFDAENSALQSAADLGEQKATEQAAYQRRADAELAAQEARMADVRQGQQAALADSQARRQKLSDDIADDKIDYEHLFKNEDGSRNWGNTVIATLAIAFGEIGRALSGSDTNAGLKIVNDKINRDMQGQKDTLAKKRGDLAEHDNLFQLMRQRFGDDNAAEAATRIAIIDKYQRGLEGLNLEYAAPEQKVRLQQAAAGLAQERAKQEQLIDQTALDNHTKAISARMQAESLGIQRTEASARMAAAAGKGSAIPGLVGTAISPEAKNKAAEVKAAADNMRSLAREARQIYAKHGHEAFGPVKERYAALHTQMQLTAKELNKLGAVSQGDAGMLDDIIGDPNAWTKTGHEGRMSTIEDIVNKGARAQLHAYGFAEDGGGSSIKTEKRQ